MGREEQLAEMQKRINAINDEIHDCNCRIGKLNQERNKLVVDMNILFDKEAYFMGNEEGNAYIFHAKKVHIDDSSYGRGNRYEGSIIYLDGSYYQDKTYIYPEDGYEMLTKEEYDDMFVNAFNEFLKYNNFDIILTK